MFCFVEECDRIQWATEPEPLSLSLGHGCNFLQLSEENSSDPSARTRFIFQNTGIDACASEIESTDMEMDGVLRWLAAIFVGEMCVCKKLFTRSKARRDGNGI